MSDPKPLKELLEPIYNDTLSQEMARRLKVLDEEIREVAEVERGHGIRHPFIFTERIRDILDGKP